MNPPSRLSVPNIEGFLCYKPEMKGSCFDIWIWKPDAEISSVLEMHAAGKWSPGWDENVASFLKRKDANVTLRVQVIHVGKVCGKGGIMKTSSARWKGADKGH